MKLAVKWLAVMGRVFKERRRVLIVIAALVLVCPFLTPYPIKVWRRIKWMVACVAARKPIAEPPVNYTAEDQIAIYGAAARARLQPKFQAKGVAYPPQRLTMVVIKSTNELKLYAAAADSTFKYICTYPVLAAR